MKTHHRQFIIGPEASSPAPNWVHVPIGEGVEGRMLSHCPHLQVQRVRDRKGCEWHVLGLPVGTPSPAVQLAQASTSEVPTIYRRWAGRWALIGNGQVHTDAGGLLGCYYRDQWASSSVALLSPSGNAQISPKHGVRSGLGWYPPPGSRFASIRKLLPSQSWRVDGTTSHRPLVGVNSPRDYASVLVDLEEHLTSAIQAAAQLGVLWLPLTGGYDSRLILAVAHKTGVLVRTFTQAYEGMSVADRNLPPKLAQIAGYSHTLLEPRAADALAYHVFDEHTAGHSLGMDRQFFARGQWEWAGTSDLILRGGGFELGRCFYYSRLPPSLDLAAITHAFSETDPHSVSSLAEWVEWGTRHPEPMDWRDRFYWEQRIGGWLSALEQALDLMQANRCYVANSHRYYELVLQVPVELRRASRYHLDLIERMAPGLLELPFNPPDPAAGAHGEEGEANGPGADREQGEADGGTPRRPQVARVSYCLGEYCLSEAAGKPTVGRRWTSAGLRSHRSCLASSAAEMGA